MTIAYVSDSVFPYNKGGKEKRLYEISTRLATRGHDVHIYCMKWWPGPEKQRIEDGVTLHAISRFYPLYNGDVRSIKQGLMFGLASLRMLGVKADIIDVDSMPFFPVYGVWLATLLRGKKLFGTWHEALSRHDWHSYMGPLGTVAWLVEHLSIKLPYAISSASAHTSSLLKKYHGRSKWVSLVTPGVDVQFFASLKPSSVRYDVMSIGRLVKDKNIDVLIRAIALHKQVQPSVRCLIVGKGPEEDNLRQLITELDLEDNVTILSFVAESSDLYAYLKAARVFALPSVREGFCMVVLEALACGTPVVTTNAEANAAKDLVRDGQTGSVVLLSPENIAAAINHWLEGDKPDIAAEVAAYDWDIIISKQLEVYST